MSASEKRKRQHLVALRLLAGERLLITKAAAAQGVSVSQFIRDAAMAEARLR